MVRDVFVGHLLSQNYETSESNLMHLESGFHDDKRTSKAKTNFKFKNVMSMHLNVIVKTVCLTFKCKHKSSLRI
jgi:hypothetical protein